MDLVRAREKARAKTARKKAPAAPAPVAESPATAPEAPAPPVPVEAPSPPAPTPEIGEAAVAAEPEEVHELLGFILGQEEYGIEIQWVEEIIKPRPVTEVPRAPAFIPGIISLRGRIIPVISLENRLGLKPAGSVPAPERGRIIVVSNPESRQPFGLSVEEVTEVIRLPVRELEPPPPTVGAEAGFLAGVGWTEGKMIIMLNLPKLLNLEASGGEKA